MQHKQSGPSEQQNTEETWDYSGLTQPGLVTFYDIKPGNGSGLFFSPRANMGLGPKACTRPIS